MVVPVYLDVAVKATLFSLCCYPALKLYFDNKEQKYEGRQSY